MNIGENFENHRGKKENLRDILLKSSCILAAIDPRPMYTVPNFRLCSGPSSGLSHMQIN